VGIYALLSVDVGEGLGERRRVEGGEQHRLADDVRHLHTELCERRRDLAADESASDHHRGGRVAGAAAELERVVDRAQEQRVSERPRPGPGRQHDRLCAELVQRLDGLTEPESNALSLVPAQRMDERVLRLGLAAKQPLRERRPVVGAVRVAGPDRDVAAASGLTVCLDELGRGQAASHDRDHVTSSDTGSSTPVVWTSWRC
jgi:hypothetical protein